jgi:uncharacterized protein
MPSQVYFIDLRAENSKSLLDKIQELAVAAGLKKVVKKNGSAAIKIHFGERGNTAFIRPLLIRPIVDAVKEAGGRPFLTDANTLYVGARGNAVDHLNTAILNGFDYSVVGAPLIIADGLDGRDEVIVPLNLNLCQQAHMGSAVARADCLISLAHFKLHEAAGFGGAIKNIGMGSASRRGKMAQHSDLAPTIIAKKCIGCGTCQENCAHGAIGMVPRPSDLPPSHTPKVTKIARIDEKKCVGCAGCIHVCPEGAIGINWEKDLPRFMERMVEYTIGALKGKEKRTLCLNFLTHISPACDCYPFADAPIVADIGILASRDPVAVDQASMDLVNAQPPLASSCIIDSPHAAHDKVKAVYPKIDWQHQLDYAQQLGLGSTGYELIKV